MKTFFLIIFSMVCINTSNATDKDFENFVSEQFKLMNTAAEKRDIMNYTILFNQFKEKYDLLSEADKKEYKNYLINGYYNYSCLYSLKNEKAKALAYLQKSIDAGYIDYAHITVDSDLDHIRSSKEFIKMVTPLRKVGDYMYILKNSEAYNNKQHSILPAFSYQISSAPELQILRKTFNLDSIAGEGNETSKVINMMYWIHNLIPHSGNQENPVVKNALSMINTCKKEQRGLNCRGLATVLNECFLSMGFKSRFVTCLPKDSLKIDFDCHVINAVYLPSLKKWVWIDPTFAAYIMNEKGELLSIPEVRERLIKNQTLILNPDANWNHTISETKKEYLYTYMAKNLYMFECPASSEYDAETHVAGKKIQYIKLKPLEYFAQTPVQSTYTNKAKVSFENYSTNNSDLFWQKP